MTWATTDELLGPLNDVERRNAPVHVYLGGDRALLEAGPRVSVVGSRRASEAGLANARHIADWLARHDMVVVSGLADGIDTAAHTSAITAGGRTIAVLGTALDACYPATNRALQAEIIRDHLALSQFAPGTPVQTKNFPMRNRTMALVSHATIIVEAAEKSGSLHQGWEALRLGRPLFILEPMLHDATLSWPREMVGYGAMAIRPDALEPMSDFLPESGRADLAEITA